ncbi:hypothetical protein SAMN04487948_14611 [Halogranum amylolyticum]|uniref:Uncharacterized protein n=1 Tax=Halogranum amylolyticum TaxID=660520 RepID=A0A1H8WIB4_9EURY|nr:hypothetical protein SAMN04487948_13040 [Halogranum amylolyticum]SEP31620.1 hypothetical protein SAMN04487948_14611 [Halogranum amylolyticum]
MVQGCVSEINRFVVLNTPSKFSTHLLSDSEEFDETAVLFFCP